MALTVDDLLKIESIKATKYAYLRFLDQHEWDQLADLFVEDATAAYSGGKYSYEGRDAIMTFLRTNMDREEFHTSHRAHHPEITFTSPTTATAIWAFEDFNCDESLDFFLMGAGFYEDRHVLVDGEWKFQHTGYKRTFEVIQAMSGAGQAMTASWWKTNGQSALDVQ